MSLLRALCLSLLPTGALACGAPVCLVNPDSLALVRVITFDAVQSGAARLWKFGSIVFLNISESSFKNRYSKQTCRRRRMQIDLKNTIFPAMW